MSDELPMIYDKLLFTKNEWDSKVSEVLRLEDPDEVIDLLDELQTDRDLLIRKTRRMLGRTRSRVVNVATEQFTDDQRREHDKDIKRFELVADEMERMMAQWEAEKLLND